MEGIGDQGNRSFLGGRCVQGELEFFIRQDCRDIREGESFAVGERAGWGAGRELPGEGGGQFERELGWRGCFASSIGDGDGQGEWGADSGVGGGFQRGCQVWKSVLGKGGDAAEGSVGAGFGDDGEGSGEVAAESIVVGTVGDGDDGVVGRDGGRGEERDGAVGFPLSGETEQLGAIEGKGGDACRLPGGVSPLELAQDSLSGGVIGRAISDVQRI